MKNLDRFAIADIEAFNTLKAGSGDFNELTRLGLHLSSVSVNGGAKLKNPNFVGLGGISITVVGNDVRISGSGTGGGGGTGSSANPVNSGDGIGIFLSKDDFSQYFKTIIGDSGIVVYDGPDGIVIGYTGAGGGGGGGGVTSIGGGSGYKSYGWYLDETSVNGDGLGPIYSFDKPIILNRVDASSKIGPLTDSTFDIEYSPDYINWNTIFTVPPVILAGTKLNEPYNFNTGFLPTGWLRFNAATNTCQGLTMQLKVMESGAGKLEQYSTSGYYVRQIKQISYTGVGGNSVKDYLAATGYVYGQFDHDIFSGSFVRLKFNGFVSSSTNNTVALSFFRGSNNLLAGKTWNSDPAGLPAFDITGFMVYDGNNSLVNPRSYEWVDFSPSANEVYSASFIPVDGGTALLNRRGSSLDIAFGMSNFIIEEYAPITTLQTTGNSGGGGGSSDFDYKSLADTVPSSPDPQNDEFDGLELDQTKWVGIQTGCYDSIFLTGNRLYLQTVNTSTSNRTAGIGQVVSGSAWEYRAQICIENPIFNYQSAALVVGNTTNDKYYTFGIMAHSSQGIRTVNCVRTNGFNSYAGEMDSYDYFGQDAYLSVKLVSGVIYFGLSKNGIVFDYCTSEAVTSHLGANPDIVGVGNHVYGDRRMITSCDWFRRIS